MYHPTSMVVQTLPESESNHHCPHCKAIPCHDNIDTTAVRWYRYCTIPVAFWSLDSKKSCSIKRVLKVRRHSLKKMKVWSLLGKTIIHVCTVCTSLVTVAGIGLLFSQPNNFVG